LISYLRLTARYQEVVFLIKTGPKVIKIVIHQACALLQIIFMLIPSLIIYMNLVAKNFTKSKRNNILACCGTVICSSIIINRLGLFYGGIAIIEIKGIEKVTTSMVIYSTIIMIMPYIVIDCLSGFHEQVGAGTGTPSVSALCLSDTKCFLQFNRNLAIVGLLKLHRYG